MVVSSKAALGDRVSKGKGEICCELSTLPIKASFFCGAEVGTKGLVHAR